MCIRDRQHCAHLLVHGCLHAQGWEHETSAADAYRRALEQTPHAPGLAQRLQALEALLATTEIYTSLFVGSVRCV